MEMTLPDPSPLSFVPVDEQAHRPSADPWWHESWSFDVWTAGGFGACTCLTVLANLGRAWYWAAVVRPDLPLLHLVDLEVPPLRPGLELRTDGLWASHVCEEPFEQWTIANEAYAVALDDPAEALARGLGVQAPVAFDLEWYAAGGPVPLSTGGYRQAGTVDGVVELAEGPVELVRAPSSRVHRWGVISPAAPAVDPLPEGVWVPFPLVGPDGPEVLDRVLTADGWWQRRR